MKSDLTAISIEAVVGGIALFLSTIGFLVGAYAIVVIGLVVGGVAFGLSLGGPRSSR